VRGLFLLPVILAACSSGLGRSDAGRDVPSDVAPVDSSADAEVGPIDAEASEVGQDTGQMLFDTGFTGFDALSYDSGDLPPGYTVDCERMRDEGCWSPAAPCDPTAFFRIEYGEWNGQTTCRCAGWPVAYWESGNGYRQRCDGSYRNRCRDQGQLETACDENMVCSGVYKLPTTGTSGQVARSRCGIPCQVANENECVELDPMMCCRPVATRERICDRNGEPVGDSVCPYPLFMSSACASQGGPIPDCP